jgi:sulfatase modifying factor 1
MMRVITAACVVILGIASMVLVPPAGGADLPKTSTGKDGAPMGLIPSGEFLMGTSLSQRDGGRDEYPERRIFLDAF